MVWQLSMAAYSKPTDAHAYLSPESCTAPHLNYEGVSVAKTVGARLRSIHSSDAELLDSLNLYSGFLIARGYNEDSIKYHLAAMANRDRILMLSGQFKPKQTLKVPLVTNLHPAITCLSEMIAPIVDAAKKDPLLKILVPPSSVIVSYRKLPNLMKLICSPDQNQLASSSSTSHEAERGYLDTGCRCDVCKISKFGRFVFPPSMPGYKVPIPTKVTCTSGPAIVYHLVCRSGRPECRRAHYVGMASTSVENGKPMSFRWSNHKSHHKKRVDKCEMTKHLMLFHRHEDPQQFVSLTILEKCSTPELAKERETIWAYDLFAFYPTGLNKREEVKVDE